MSDDDLRAFREAMHGVRRLPSRETAIATPKPRPAARFTRAEEREVLRESLLPPADPALLYTGEELSFRRPGVGMDALRRLRRGQFVVAAEIDLHGLGRHAAHEALRDFIARPSSARRGRIRRSPSGTPPTRTGPS